jgi:hypothetical protein
MISVVLLPTFNYGRDSVAPAHLPPQRRTINDHWKRMATADGPGQKRGTIPYAAEPSFFHFPGAGIFMMRPGDVHDGEVRGPRCQSRSGRCEDYVRPSAMAAREARNGAGGQTATENFADSGSSRDQRLRVFREQHFGAYRANSALNERQAVKQRVDKVRQESPPPQKTQQTGLRRTRANRCV